MGQGHVLCTCKPVSAGEFEWSPAAGATTPRRVEPSHSASALPANGRAWRVDPVAQASAPGEEALVSRRRDREKDEATTKLLKEALRANRLCGLLEDCELDQLVGSLQYHVLSTGDFATKEGALGTHVFVADAEGLQATLRGGSIGAVPRWRAFGEDALLKKCPRSVSVVATRPVGLWAGEGRHFRRVVRGCVMQRVADDRAFLDAVRLLEGLTARQRDAVSDASWPQIAEVGEWPARLGQETDHVYLVKSGKLRVVAGGDDGRQHADDALLGAGSCLCERALIYGEAFSMTAEVVKRCELLRVNVPRLRQALGEDFNPVKLQAALLAESLARCGFFATWSRAQLLSAAGAMEFQEHPMYSTIMESRFFVVLDGSLQVGDGPTSQVLRRGDSCGVPQAQAQGEDTPPVAGTGATPTAAAAELVAGRHGSRLAVLPDHALLLCDPEQTHAHTARVLSKVCVFRHLTDEEINALAERITKRRYNFGECVFKQGERGSDFYVMAAGRANAVKNGRILRTLGRYAYFGERALLFEEPRMASIEVSSPEGAEVWCLGRETFMERVLSRDLTYEQLIYRVWLQDPGIGLSDLQELGQVGHGTSGTVSLVKHRQSGYKYALKKVRKPDGQVARELRREIEVLAENDHPFVTHLVKTLETPEHLYLLMEYCSGGELHRAIRTLPDPLSRPAAMFYAGSIMLALESLHERYVVFRDLKPENIMLDSIGYVKMIDFGSAKKLEQSSLRTFTMVGTPHYMAPEVLRDKGYGTEVDVWALGVILYELTCGHLPFGEDAETSNEVFKEVLLADLRFPEDLEEETCDLVAGLLVPKPEQRFGCGPLGLEDVKACPFFGPEGLDDADRAAMGEKDYFRLLLVRELHPPIPPSAPTPDARSPVSNEPEAQDNTLQFRDGPTRHYQQSLMRSGASVKDAPNKGSTTPRFSQEGRRASRKEPEEEGDPEDPSSELASTSTPVSS